MIPGRSGASDLGGSPCQQQGGFGAVPSLGCLHSLPLCLQVTVTYLSLPELPVSLKVTAGLSSDLCPGNSRLTTPLSPQPSFQPQAPPWCTCSSWAVAPAVAAWDAAEPMAHSRWPFPPGQSTGQRPIHVPALEVALISQLSSWVSWGSKLTQVNKERGLISCFRKWFVKWVLFCFYFQLLMHNMWPHLEFLKVHLWDSEEWVSRCLAYTY